MTFEQAKREADRLNALVASTGAALQAFPKGPLGITPDAVKGTLEWLTAKREFDRAFYALRTFNAHYTKRFAAELRAERAARRAA